MTKKELNQLHYLNKEIKMLDNRLREIRQASTVQGQQITGMPFGGGVSDSVADKAVNVAELERLIKLKREQCEIELLRLTRYINSVDDSLMRQILSYRYVNSLSWAEIALHIGGNNTPDSIRKSHDRFLKSQEENKSCPFCPF